MRDRLQSDKCAHVLKALAEPQRLRIVQALQGGPKTVSALAAELKQDLVNVSHHLGVLRQAGLVLNQRRGKYILYSLNPDVFQPTAGGRAGDRLDFGCCQLLLGDC